jgi:hypothetical protein
MLNKIEIAALSLLVPFFFLIGNLCGIGQDLGRVYTGPNELGYFHIDHDTSVQHLFRVLGKPLMSSKEPACYKNGIAYLWFERRAHSSTIVGDIMLSSFPNCMDSPVRTTSEVLQKWRTEKGIGLGSTELEVIKAYGKASERQIKGTAYRSLIQGDYLVRENRYANIKRPELGEKALIYGSSDDMRSAAFGIKNGKVVWISLTNTE